MPLDKIIDKIVGLGIPGLVLVIAIATSGLAGGAAIVASLALLGGPLGMIGGVILLGVLLMVSQAVAKYGVETIVKGTVQGLVNKGTSVGDIKKAVESYPISKDLKRKIIAWL